MASTEKLSGFEKHKVAVLVPTYNNATTLEKVLRNVLHYTDHVIVVNDGSTDNTPLVLSNFPSLDVIGYNANCGKGHALRMGFHHAVLQGYRYVITIDSDGQHFPDDLPQFLNALENSPGALIMGVRNMEQSSVPGKSSFGHKFSNFWFWVETGLKIGDTQSGYRLYPVGRLENIRFYTPRFEFEIEVLVRAAWRGIEIAEVPVRVFYAEAGKRISHFRPFRDFARISALNTVLVTIALSYIKPRDFLRQLKKKKFWQPLAHHLSSVDERDSIKALSVAFGVFMGIVPLWGFQLVIAIALSFLFRLNKVLVIVAANISIPPMIPLILFLSHAAGAIWMGDKAQAISFHSITFESVRDNSLQYVVGAITLAVVAGVSLGGLTYLGLKLYRRLKSE